MALQHKRRHDGAKTSESIKGNVGPPCEAPDCQQRWSRRGEASALSTGFRCAPAVHSRPVSRLFERVCCFQVTDAPSRISYSLHLGCATNYDAGCKRPQHEVVAMHVQCNTLKSACTGLLRTNTKAH